MDVNSGDAPVVDVPEVPAVAEVAGTVDAAVIRRSSGYERSQFTGFALMGVASRSAFLKPEEIAEQAVRLADATLAALEATRDPRESL